MSTANRVLELLYDRRGLFGLDELVSAAGSSRRELDGVFRELRRRGQELQFLPDRGVQLIRPAALDSHLIERQLGTRRVGRHAICFAEVDSTNDVAFDSARQVDADGLVVLAEHQRQGRGRQGRTWISAPGTGVLMSVLLLEVQTPLPQEAVVIAAGLSVAEGVDDALGLSCGLEWPNDVLLDGAKVAGILVERRRQDRRTALVIGIGINANASPPPEMVAGVAASLAEHLGEPVERIELVRAVLCRLDDWLGRIAAGKLEELHESWLLRCGMINRRITVVCGGRRYVGRVLDVSPLEGMVLSCDSGQRVHLPAENATVED